MTLPAILGSVDAKTGSVEILDARSRDRGRTYTVTAAVDGLPAEVLVDLTADGRVVRFEMKSAAPAGALTRRMLCAAPIGEIQRTFRARVDASSARWAAAARKTEAPPDPHSLLGRLASDSHGLAEEMSRRPGAAGRGDKHYAEIAAKYVKALKLQHPVEAVAEATGMSPKAVRNVLYKARERDLLTSVGQGRAGGKLTDKAERLLAGEED